ncbi:O-antigen ligase family protein [Providencia sp. PROV064]|uniref:O-antigen ligase family protein n=1 Tax=Providencia sp. PROV064 TaxID=2949790 RepID=UPI00234A7D75|nr:O-antigen ligase family protein [Providencia sp. PROV064]
MNINKFKTEITTFSCFIILFIPSIKYLFFSNVVNIFSVLLLIASLIFNLKKIKISKFEAIIIIIIDLFILTQLFSGFNPDISLDLQDILKYISLIIISTIIGLIYKFIDLKKLHIYIILWSDILIVLYLIDIISPSGAGELSYLILSMQLGIGFCAAISLALLNKKINFSNLFNAAVILLTISTLAGRTAIILSAIVLIFVLFLFIKSNYKSNILKVSFLVLSLSLILVISWPIIFSDILNEYFLYKLEKMFTSGDGRFDTYINSINIISDNWFGIGLHQYNTVLGFYPHNIFLESMLNAGIISGLILFLFFMIWLLLFIQNIYKYKKNNPYLISLGLLSAFLFISWNTSNNITSAYVPFSAMILSIMFNYKEKHV